MSTKKYYETAAFKATQAEWYAKLKAEGFEDIEREGHTDLAGPRASVSLRAVQNDLGIATSRDPDETLDADHPLVKYQGGYRARYYHHAHLIVSENVREGMDPRRVYVRQLHTEWLSQRDIMARGAEDHDHGARWSRRYVRNEVELFAREIRSRLDNG